MGSQRKDMLVAFCMTDLQFDLSGYNELKKEMTKKKLLQCMKLQNKWFSMDSDHLAEDHQKEYLASEKEFQQMIGTSHTDVDTNNKKQIRYQKKEDWIF